MKNNYLRKLFKIMCLLISVIQICSSAYSDELEINVDSQGNTYYSCTAYDRDFVNYISTDHYSQISSSCVDMWKTHAGKFGLKSNDWKNGWGFNSCTEKSPLKRVLKSLELIKISRNDNLSSNKAINYMYNRAANYTNEIKPLCARDENQGAVGSFAWGKMKLYSAGIKTDLMYLTSIITHEARHRKKMHNVFFSPGECTWGGSCDSSYDYYGANAYELVYLWAYGVQSQNSSRYTRQRALDIAQITNKTAFKVSPNFNIPVYASE